MSKTYRHESDPDRIRNPRRIVTRIASVILALSIASHAAALTSTTSTHKAAEQITPPHTVVNVNTATVEQIAFLPGVGATTASRIVEYRGGVETGKPAPYKSVDDLLNVKGIGPKKLAAMRAFVVLNGATTATAKLRAAKVVKP